MTLFPGRRSTVLLLLALLVSAAGGCGTASPDAVSPRGEVESLRQVRDAVVNGAARDFAEGTGIGGPAYERCVLGGLRRALDRPTLTRLIQVYRRPHGQQFAAQALNGLAMPLGAGCGHRFYVPELVEASRGLVKGKLLGGAVSRLRVTYGPYLGVRCRRANRIGCDRVGIDVVFGRAATGVVAVLGGRVVRLRTPGLHNGIRGHDWVGTLTHAGIGRPGGPFQPRGDGRVRGFWTGSPPIYVAVELRVRFASGRRAAARFPSIFLSPGWG